MDTIVYISGAISQINSSDMSPWIVGLLVIGWKDPVYECVIEDSFV